MATKLTTPLGDPLIYALSLITDIDEVVVSSLKNLRAGPCRLLGFLADNSRFGNPSSACYLKIYDIIDDSLVAGSSRSRIMFPIPAGVLTDASTYAGGIIGALFLPGGIPLHNGLSALAAQEDGDDVTTAPAEQLRAFFITTSY